MITILLAALLGLSGCGKPAPSAGTTAAASPDLSGYWAGKLDVGQLQLRIGTDLIADGPGKYRATFDSLDQGLKDYPASATQDGTALTLRIDLKQSGQGIFVAKLSGDGQQLEGTWSQGPAKLPLTLIRGDRSLARSAGAAKTDLPPEELAANREAAKRAAGAWSGTLNVQGKKLRLIFHLAAEGDGTCSATLNSLDQGNTALPVTRVGLTGDHLTLDLPGIGGSYNGTLSTNPPALSGTWVQLGRSYPLDLSPSKE